MTDFPDRLRDYFFGFEIVDEPVEEWRLKHNIEHKEVLCAHCKSVLPARWAYSGPGIAGVIYEPCECARANPKQAPFAFVETDPVARAQMRVLFQELSRARAGGSVTHH